MKDRPWDRDAVIADLRSRIWLHLSGASTAHQVELEAAALLQLPPEDVARLGDLHFVLDPAVTTLLEAAPGLLRRLASDSTPLTEIGHDRIRGPVDWTATTRARALTRTPVVVAHPRERDADVQPNRLLALLLGQVQNRARSFGSLAGRQTDTTVGSRIATIGGRAAVLAAHRALRDVTTTAPSARELAGLGGIRLRRRYAPLLRAWEVYQRLVLRSDPASVRRAVERHGFAVTSDGALFELLIVFGIRDALLARGYRMEPIRLFEGSLRFGASRGDDRITTWYQSVPRPLTLASAYLAAHRAHRLGGAHDLRPDVVLRVEPAHGPDRWLVIEAKTTTSGRGVPELFRRALADLLAYRAAYDGLLNTQRQWGLGVVWGLDLPAADHPVAICTPDQLTAAMAQLVESGF